MKILIDTNIIIDALTSREPWNKDAVIEQVARRARMDYIVTRNQKDYKEGIIKVMLPDEFIKLVEQSE